MKPACHNPHCQFVRNSYHTCIFICHENCTDMGHCNISGYFLLRDGHCYEALNAEPEWEVYLFPVALFVSGA